MIIIDTHIWIWWTHNIEHLNNVQLEALKANETTTIGVSAISCWEISKLFEHGKIELPCSIEEWFKKALSYPAVTMIPLTPEIAIESTRLPDTFHKDPADQLIVATARVFDSPLVTSDHKILAYNYVRTIG
ncbi:MAG: type II toxin-antitoxin system VapC family toxin [Desulfamplus sp.]|nr:type II toxin-antitoxin system VapC family toxin [Desulfamplus sp.]